MSTRLNRMDRKGSGRVALSLFIAAISVSLVTGCGSAATDPDPTRPVAHVTRSSQPDVAESEPDALTTVLVIYKTGGIAGVQEITVVQPNGGYVLKGQAPGHPRTGRMTDRELATLAKAANSAGLNNLEPGPHNVCADQFHYTFSYGKQYYESDDCPEMPAKAAKVIAALPTV